MAFSTCQHLRGQSLRTFWTRGHTGRRDELTKGQKMRRIRQISIKNLFGIFNHDIHLNIDERVTIVHSPNGFGKTAILKLLNELFTQGISIIRSTPFDEFHIYFEDETHFWIEKKSIDTIVLNSENAVASKQNAHIVFYCEDSKKKRVFAIELKDRDTNNTRLRAELQYHERLLQSAKLAPEDRRTIEETIQSLRQILLGEEMRLVEQEESKHIWDSAVTTERGKERDLFQDFRKCVPVRFIETQRLLNVTAEVGEQSSARRPAMLPAVRMYSDELSETITAKLADSTTLTQSLDRTFPSRLVDLATRQSDISESHEPRLESAGLAVGLSSL